MELFYRVAADAVVVVHFAFVAFVLFGQILILLGGLLRWEWVRNLWFRAVHLTSIAVVVAEVWCGVTCPLTTWERDLRELAGQTTYRGDFIAHWAHELLFYNLPPSAFAIIYTVFGALVLATLWFVPPRRPSTGSPTESGALGGRPASQPSRPTEVERQPTRSIAG